MANEEQLAILKQGVEVWNEWRRKNNYIIDLAEADLSEKELEHISFWSANLRKANLNGVNLSRAMAHSADFTETNCVDANLSYAFLFGADFSRANFFGANLTKASLQDSRLTQARIGYTNFGSNDLSSCIGLETITHSAPSFISINTISESKGRISEVFLKGCGLSDWEIESVKLYNPDLTNDEIVKIQYRIYELRASQALQISPLFISYSHADKSFVDKMDNALTKKGIRFWRDIHDATAGRLETQIDRAIRQNPTVLVVLSKNSVKSDWVEHEVRTARELEKDLGHDALCPIALDDSWKSSSWPKRVMEQIMEYNILDFSKWEDEAVFEEKFSKLLSGLDLFYKKPAA